jgi:Mg2+/Co2+ transporter CorB
MISETLAFLKDAVEKSSEELKTYVTRQHRKILKYEEIHQGRLGQIIDEYLGQ